MEKPRDEEAVTAPYLGSIDYRYTFKLGLLPYLFLPFSVLLFYLLLPTASPYVAFHFQRTFFFHPLSTSSTGEKCRLPGFSLHLTPTSLCCSFLRPAPRACVCSRSRDGVLPLLPPLTCTQVPVSSWGVLASRVPPRLCTSASHYLSSPPNTGIVWSSVLLSGKFSHEGEIPGSLHSLEVTRAGPCSPRYLYIPAPFRIFRPTPPPSPLYTHPLSS